MVPPQTDEIVLSPRPQTRRFEAFQASPWTIRASLPDGGLFDGEAKVIAQIHTANPGDDTTWQSEAGVVSPSGESVDLNFTGAQTNLPLDPLGQVRTYYLSIVIDSGGANRKAYLCGTVDFRSYPFAPVSGTPPPPPPDQPATLVDLQQGLALKADLDDFDLFKSNTQAGFLEVADRLALKAPRKHSAVVVTPDGEHEFFSIQSGDSPDKRVASGQAILRARDRIVAAGLVGALLLIPRGVEANLDTPVWKTGWPNQARVVFGDENTADVLYTRLEFQTTGPGSGKTLKTITGVPDAEVDGTYGIYGPGRRSVGNFGLCRHDMFDCAHPVNAAWRTLMQLGEKDNPWLNERYCIPMRGADPATTTLTQQARMGVLHVPLPQQKSVNLYGGFAYPQKTEIWLAYGASLIGEGIGFQFGNPFCSPYFWVHVSSPEAYEYWNDDTVRRGQLYYMNWALKGQWNNLTGEYLGPGGFTQMWLNTQFGCSVERLAIVCDGTPVLTDIDISGGAAEGAGLPAGKANHYAVSRIGIHLQGGQGTFLRKVNIGGDCHISCVGVLIAEDFEFEGGGIGRSAIAPDIGFNYSSYGFTLKGKNWIEHYNGNLERVPLLGHPEYDADLADTDAGAGKQFYYPLIWGQCGEAFDIGDLQFEGDRMIPFFSSSCGNGVRCGNFAVSGTVYRGLVLRRYARKVDFRNFALHSGGFLAADGVLVDDASEWSPAGTNVRWKMPFTTPWSDQSPGYQQKTPGTYTGAPIQTSWAFWQQQQFRRGIYAYNATVAESALYVVNEIDQDAFIISGTNPSAPEKLLGGRILFTWNTQPVMRLGIGNHPAGTWPQHFFIRAHGQADNEHVMAIGLAGSSLGNVSFRGPIYIRNPDGLATPKVLGFQQPGIPDLAPSATLAEVIADLAALKAMIRTHGLMAT